VDVAWWGTLAGVPAFAAIIASGPMSEPALFVAGTWLAGLGAGLFGHGTLTATMRSAPREQVGLALGAWGAVQATAAGIAVALGGIIRDLITALPGAEGFRPEAPYTPVFTLELLLLRRRARCDHALLKRDGLAIHQTDAILIHIGRELDRTSPPFPRSLRHEAPGEQRGRPMTDIDVNGSFNAT
jgi:MFS family permease